MKNNSNSLISKIKSLFLNIFFPEECVVCEKSGETICEKCLEEIKSDKAKENIKTDWIKSCFNYKNEILKKAIYSLKYHHTKSISKYLAKITALEFFDFIKDNNSENLIIIPIPISRKRKIERDYNQSELIIREIIKEIKLQKDINLEKNLFIDLLIKNKHTIKFAKTHSISEREKLIENAFSLNQKYKDLLNTDFQNKKIILFDDILTTGTTFYEARKTLINSGAEKENIFAFAVTH